MSTSLYEMAGVHWRTYDWHKREHEAQAPPGTVAKMVRLALLVESKPERVERLQLV